MNLWVKRTGQFLLAALFLMSCEDDSFLLGFRNQNKKFNVGYQEFFIGVANPDTGSNDSEVIAIDSIITDNLTGARRLLVGDYIDPVVGSVKAESFLDFLPTNTAKLDTTAGTVADYELDSLVLQMRLDYYSYGLVGDGISKFKVHELEDTLSYKKDITIKINNSDGVLVDSVVSWYGANRYYANSTVPYNESEFLGETRLVRLNRIKGEEQYTNTTLKLSRLEAGQDTLLAMARIDQLWAEQLFEDIRHDANSVYSDGEKFRSRFKGLILIPSESNAVLGYNPSDTYTRLVLYYHSNDEFGNKKDTLYSIFKPATSFHKITPIRTAEFPAPDPAYTGVALGSVRAVQSGNTLITKIDLNNFFAQFADTIKDQIVINSAELLIQSVASQEGYKPISNLEIRILKENDRYLDYRIEEDSVYANGYGFVVPSYVLPSNYYRYHYFVINDLGTVANLSYSSSKEKYSGFITQYFQEQLDRVLENKINLDAPKPLIRYLGLYPTGEIGKSINRTVFDKSTIKLRIYYTYPNKTNL